METRFPSMSSIGSLLRLYKVNAVKRLSQNFILDPHINSKIVRAAGPLKDSLVCEVGPGPGGITRAILKQKPKFLFLVEKDKRFEPMLQCLEEAVADVTDVKTVYTDILDYDISEYFDKNYKKEWDWSPPKIHILGNLPFDVSTILLIKWLEDISLQRNIWSMGRVKMTLTFQLEVAERIIAQIMKPNRCRLSVICQNYCHAKLNFIIKGESFVPPPKVDVGVVTLVPHIKPVFSHPFKITEKVLRVVFNHRNKYLSYCVEMLFPQLLRKKLGKELLQMSELEPEMRPFAVSVVEFGRLIQAYRDICDRDPTLYDYDFRAPIKNREIGWANSCVNE